MQCNLSQYRINVQSQFGEDGVVEKLFEIMNIKKGWLVEFGAWEGTYLSNTRHHYLKNPAFEILLAEPEVDRYIQLERNYPESKAVLLNSKIELAGRYSLNSIFDIYNVFDIALLSIDVDGEDLAIWNSLNKEKYRPRVVIIEYGDWKNGIQNLVKPFEDFGYNLVAVTGNFIFVDNQTGVRSVHTPQELILSSGMQEYDHHYGKITTEELDNRTKRQGVEKNLYTQTAGPQIIQY